MKSLSESTVRRRAKKLGLKLQKSRIRNKDWLGYGKFCLVNLEANTLVHGSNHDGFGASLAECAEYIHNRASKQQK